MAKEKAAEAKPKTERKPKENSVRHCNPLSQAKPEAPRSSHRATERASEKPAEPKAEPKQ